MKCITMAERCVMASAPTLYDIAREYGKNIAVKWLIVELNDYNNFAGVKEEGKQSLAQLRQTALIIVSKYGYLKLSELLLFFGRLKSGDYCQMYGTIDPVKILRALGAFLNDRNLIIEKAESKALSKQLEEQARKGVSYNEYKQMKASGVI